MMDSRPIQAEIWESLATNPNISFDNAQKYSKMAANVRENIEVSRLGIRASGRKIGK